MTFPIFGFAMVLGVVATIVLVRNGRTADVEPETPAPALVAASGRQAHRDACGDCHVAYAPYFLPADSWRAMGDALPEHFGVRLHLPVTKQGLVLAWLRSNAADAGHSLMGAEVMARVAPTDRPLRVTATRWFRHRHLMISRSTWALPVVATPANCPACHHDAAQGIFDERSVHIPG